MEQQQQQLQQEPEQTQTLQQGGKSQLNCRRGKASRKDVNKPAAAEAKRKSLQQRAEAEAPRLQPRLEALRRLHEAGDVSAPDACLAYVIACLQVRHGPDRWLAGRRNAPVKTAFTNDYRPLQTRHSSVPLSTLVETGVIESPSDKSLQRVGLDSESTLCELQAKANLLGQPGYATCCIERWFRGERPLVLLWRIPSATELLDMQATGKRCVSALSSATALSTIFGHRDCLEMLVHDLSHAEHFVNEKYEQQVGFFAFLRATVRPIHEEQWSSTFGHRWRLAWQYVSSDMNSTAVHMLLTLKYQLMGAVARATLWKRGHTVPDDNEEDFEMAKSDIYPKSGYQADWREALQAFGLTAAYDEAFAECWHSIVESHLAHVKHRFPHVLADEVPEISNAVSKEPEVHLQGDMAFQEWPRPGPVALVSAFNQIGTGRRTSWEPMSDPAAETHHAETGFHGIYARHLTAHFDELGRSVMLHGPF